MSVCVCFCCFLSCDFKGENLLWKGEEREDFGDLDSAGETPCEFVSAFDRSSWPKAAEGSDRVSGCGAALRPISESSEPLEPWADDFAGGELRGGFGGFQT